MANNQSASRLEAYAAWRTPFLSGWQQVYGQAQDTAVVAETFWRANNDCSSRVHYTAGKGLGAMLTLRRWLPETLFERTLRQALGPERKGTARAQTRKGETATTLSVR